MRIIFFGSDPWFSPPVLAALSKARHQISLIVTKGNAFENFRFHNSDLRFIEAKTAEDISLARLVGLLRSDLLAPDAIVLASFGPPFLPAEILNWPKYGCLNVHASLLPRWRGASPVFASLREGNRETGISIMRMTEKVDRGAVLGQKKIMTNQPLIGSCGETRIVRRQALSVTDDRRQTIDETGFATATDTPDTRETLTRRLGILGGELIVETLKKLETGQITETPQPEKSPTPYTRRLTKNSGLIDWSKSPAEIERFIRAVTPWPGAWTKYKDEGRRTKDEGKVIKILKAHLEKLPQRDCHAPTDVGARNDVTLVIDLLQLPGKNPISWQQFLAGHPVAKLG